MIPLSQGTGAIEQPPRRHGREEPAEGERPPGPARPAAARLDQAQAAGQAPVAPTAFTIAGGELDHRATLPSRPAERAAVRYDDHHEVCHGEKTTEARRPLRPGAPQLAALRRGPRPPARLDPPALVQEPRRRRAPPATARARRARPRQPVHLRRAGPALPDQPGLRPPPRLAPRRGHRAARP